MNTPEIAVAEPPRLFSSGKRTLIENFVAVSSIQAANYILPLLTLPYLIRVLGPEKYGLINFAAALVGYFGVLTDYGFNLSATQEVSVHRDDRNKTSEIFSAVLLIKLGLVVFSLAVLCGLLLTVSRFREHAALYLYTFGLVAGNVLLPNWFFQGIERMKYITFFNVLAKLIFTVSIFIVVKRPDDFVYVPLLNSAGFMIAGIVGLIVAVKTFGVRLRRPPAKEVVHQLRKGWHVFISTVAVSAYTGTRVFAVGLLTNNTITGYYALAEKLMSLVQMFPLGALVSVIYPRMSNIHFHDPARGLQLMRRLQRYAMLGSLVVLPVVFVLAPWIVFIVSGSFYHETILSFRLLLLAIFFINANAFRVQFLFIIGRLKAFSRMHLIVGSVGIVATFLATYMFSYIGTAVAIAGIELLMLTLTIKNLKTSYQGV